MRDPDSSWGMRVSRHLGRILCGKHQRTLLKLRTTWFQNGVWFILLVPDSYHGILSNFNGKENPSSPSTRWIKIQLPTALEADSSKSLAISSLQVRKLTEGGVSVVSTVFKSKPNALFWGGRKPGFHKTPRKFIAPEESWLEDNLPFLFWDCLCFKGGMLNFQAPFWTSV